MDTHTEYLIKVMEKAIDVSLSKHRQIKIISVLQALEHIRYRLTEELIRINMPSLRPTETKKPHA